MASCEQCGAALDAARRDCGRCGAAVSARADLGLLVLSDVEPDPVIVSRRPRGSRAMVVVGVLLAGLVAWSLGGSSDNEADSGVTDEAQSAATTEAAALPVAAPDDAQPAPAALVASGGVPVVEAGQFVGTGLTLAAGDPLVLVDLDTGEARATGLENAEPLAVVDGVLLVRLYATDPIVGLRVGDLSAPPVIFDAPPRTWPMRASAGGEIGTVEVMAQSWDANDPAIDRFTFDVDTGARIRSEQLELPVLGTSLWPDTNARFRTPAAGGVYEQTDEGWRRVLDGRVVAQGHGLVLIESCDENLACGFTWRTDDLEPVALPVPPSIVEGVVLAGGKAMSYRSSIGRDLRLIDLRSGATLASLLDDTGSDGGVSVGPNDRYVTYVTFGSTVVHDLDTGDLVDVGIEAGFGEVAGRPLLFQAS